MYCKIVVCNIIGNVYNFQYILTIISVIKLKDILDTVTYTCENDLTVNKVCL